MTTSRATLRNWRDADSYIGHDNAIVCAIFSPPKEGETPDPHQCLQHMNGFARHNLQGGKDGDRHAHTHAEQYYYILSGEADVDIGDDTYPVREGTVCYFPPDVEHQLRAADRTEWVEYLIITSGTEASGSKPYVTNWRGSTPAIGSHGLATTWPILERLNEEKPTTSQPCLLSFHYLVRQAVSRGCASDMHQHDDKEQIYYVLEGEGTVVTGFDAHPLREGDTVYLPQGMPHMILNDRGDDWLSYLVVS